MIHKTIHSNALVLFAQPGLVHHVIQCFVTKQNVIRHTNNYVDRYTVSFSNDSEGKLIFFLRIDFYSRDFFSSFFCLDFEASVGCFVPCWVHPLCLFLVNAQHLQPLDLRWSIVGVSWRESEWVREWERERERDVACVERKKERKREREFRWKIKYGQKRE